MCYTIIIRFGGKKTIKIQRNEATILKQFKLQRRVTSKAYGCKYIIYVYCIVENFGSIKNIGRLDESSLICQGFFSTRVYFQPWLSMCTHDKVWQFEIVLSVSLTV